jgi:hypothetical protein
MIAVWIIAKCVCACVRALLELALNRKEANKGEQ